jgi:putative transposase
VPQSLSKVFIHLVFSTKNRRPFIDEAIQPELYPYIAKVLYGECSSPAKIIGGVEDHLHILLNLSRTISIANLVETIKVQSSKWIKTKGSAYSKFHWQTGYGAFSVSSSAVDAVSQYILGQKDHHRKRTFMDEYRGLLDKHEMEYDEKYVWD